MTQTGNIQIFEVSFDDGRKSELTLIRGYDSRLWYITKIYGKDLKPHEVSKRFDDDLEAGLYLDRRLKEYASDGGQIKKVEQPLSQWIWARQTEAVFDPVLIQPDAKPDFRITKQKPQKHQNKIKPQRQPVKKNPGKQRVKATKPETENQKKPKIQPDPPKDKEKKTPLERTKTKQPERQQDNQKSGKKEGPSGVEGMLQDAEKGISGFFDEGRATNEKLRGRLENYVLDGGSPIWGALGASGLDFLDMAMGIAEGIPMGLLDTRRLGEGLAKGTWQGAKEDAQRLLNIIPQGKLLKAVDYGLTATDVGTQVKAGNYKEAGLAAGMLVAAARTKGKQRSFEDDFAHDCAQQFKKDYKKVHDHHARNSGKPRAWRVSGEAHQKTQKAIKRRHGSDVETREKNLSLGVSHWGRTKGKLRFNRGARPDLLHKPTNTVIELKANASLKDGQIRVNKKVDGKWMSAVTDQILSLEIYAKATGGKVYITTSKGKVYAYNPTRYRWIEVK